MTTRSLLRLGIPLLAASLMLTACGGSGGGNPLAAGAGKAPGTIVVGSQSFPESALLGEVYAQALEKAGYTVQRQPNIGAREVLYGQVKSCSIDVTPEYNSALLAYLQAGPGGSGETTVPSTTAEVDAKLASALPASLEALQSAKAEDNNAVAVTRQTAAQHKLTALPDLAAVAGQFVFGGPPEFKSRQQGILGLSKMYGINFADYRVLDYSGPITVTALQGGDIQAALLFSTSPQINESGFVVLKDPKNVLGVNNIVPLACKSGLPDGARAVLDRVSASLTTENLTAINKSYVIDKNDVGNVAGKWLADNGLG